MTDAQRTESEAFRALLAEHAGAHPVVVLDDNDDGSISAEISGGLFGVLVCAEVDPAHSGWSIVYSVDRVPGMFMGGLDTLADALAALRVREWTDAETIVRLAAPYCGRGLRWGSS